MRRGDANPKPDAPLRLPTRQRVHPGAEVLVGWDGQVEAFTQTVGVQPQQASFGADYWATGGSGQ
jgi:hypothetical protein